MGWLRLILCCGVFIGVRSARVLNVHEDVMSFIMGCDGRFRSENPPPAPTLPITRTDIDPETGIETESIAMVDIPQLEKSLRESVGDDEVVSHILAHVEENLKARHDMNVGKRGCTNIRIDVPPQKVTGLSEQLQAVVQQNNYQLLEQVNTLFTFKLNSFYKEVEELLSSQTGKLGEGLLQLQQSQQQVAESLSNSPKEQCVSAGETRIFQSDSSPSVTSPLPDTSPVLGKEEEKPLPFVELLYDEEPLRIEGILPIKEPLPVQEHDPVGESLDIEEPLPIEEPLLIEEPLPIEEPFPVKENHSASKSQVGLNSEEPEVESQVNEPVRNVIAPRRKNVPEVVEVAPIEEVESEPRRIGFRRRRPGILRRRRPNTPLNAAKDDPYEQPPTESSPEEEVPKIEVPEEEVLEEEVPDEEAPASPKSRMDLLMRRRKLLLSRQQRNRG